MENLDGPNRLQTLYGELFAHSSERAVTVYAIDGAFALRQLVTFLEQPQVLSRLKVLASIALPAGSPIPLLLQCDREWLKKEQTALLFSAVSGLHLTRLAITEYEKRGPEIPHYKLTDPNLYKGWNQVLPGVSKRRGERIARTVQNDVARLGPYVENYSADELRAALTAFTTPLQGDYETDEMVTFLMAIRSVYAGARLCSWYAQIPDTPIEMPEDLDKSSYAIAGSLYQTLSAQLFSWRLVSELYSEKTGIPLGSVTPGLIRAWEDTFTDPQTTPYDDARHTVRTILRERGFNTLDSFLDY